MCIVTWIVFAQLCHVIDHVLTTATIFQYDVQFLPTYQQYFCVCVIMLNDTIGCYIDCIICTTLDYWRTQWKDRSQANECVRRDPDVLFSDTDMVLASKLYHALTVRKNRRLLGSVLMFKPVRALFKAYQSSHSVSIRIQI
jgi:hypothetical protein